MKKTMVAIGILIGLALIVVIALPFLLNLNQYRDQYLPVIENVLQRKVEIPQVQLTLVPRLGLQITDTKVYDDPAVSENSFITIEKIGVTVKWIPLLRGNIEIENVTLHHPVVTIIRTLEGSLNITTLGGKDVADDHENTLKTPQGAPLAVLAMFGVQQLTITQGTLQYEDRVVEDPKTYRLEQLDVTTRSVKLGQVAQFQAQGLLMPFQLPVSFEGSAGPLQQTFDLAEIKTQLLMGTASLHGNGQASKGMLELKLTSKMIIPSDLPVDLQFNGPVRITDLVAHLQASLISSPNSKSTSSNMKINPFQFNLEMGNASLDITGSATKSYIEVHGTSPVIQSTDLPVTLRLKHPVAVKQFDVKAQIRDNLVEIASLKGTVFNGNLTMEGMWERTKAAHGAFQSNGTFQEFDVEELQKVLKPNNIQLTGKGVVDWNMKGSLRVDAPPRLVGWTNITVMNGELVGIDLLERIEHALKLEGLLSKNRGSTSFNKLEGKVDLQGDRFPIQQFVLEGQNQDFILHGSGMLKLDHTIALKGELRLAPHLSKQIVQKKPIAKIALRQGELVAPFMVDGTISNPRVRLDLGAVQQHIQKKVGEAVQDILKGNPKDVGEILKKGKSLLKQFFGKYSESK